MRPFDMTDAGDFFRLNTDPEVVRFLGIEPMNDPEQALSRLHSIRDQYEKYGIGRYAVIEKNSGQFIGLGGLKFFEHAAVGYDNICDLGYVLIKDAWGKGYASEISRAWLDYAFHTLQMADVYGMTDPENAASEHVLLKAGMQFVELIIFEGMETNLFRMKNPALV